MKAKFLWKRIPDILKQDPNNELNSLWSLIRFLIQRKYSEAFGLANQYKSSNRTWSSTDLSNLLDNLMEKSKERVLDLVNLAYSSIHVQEFANLFGLSVDDAKKMALVRDWTLDESKTYLLPKKKRN
jgi:hypothetical protein